MIVVNLWSITFVGIYDDGYIISIEGEGLAREFAFVLGVLGEFSTLPNGRDST